MRAHTTRCLPLMVVAVLVDFVFASKRKRRRRGAAVPAPQDA